MSAESGTYARKLILSAIGLVWLVASGASFYSSRRLEEPVVLSEGVTEVKRLSEYFDGVRGTANDCNVYILEGKEEGGTIFVMGGSHPEEPAGRLAAWLFAENAVMQRGRLILVLSSNRSASTVTRVGGAYPPDFMIPTDWGGQKLRMGDRWSNQEPEQGLAGQSQRHPDRTNLLRVHGAHSTGKGRRLHRSSRGGTAVPGH